MTLASVHPEFDTIGQVTWNPGDLNVYYDPNGAFDHLSAGEVAFDRFFYSLVDNRGPYAAEDAHLEEVVIVVITGVDNSGVAS